MRHKIIYTADIHGNEAQYRKLVEFAVRARADSIIIGGDLAPKSAPSDEYIASQRSFLEACLPRFLSPLKKALPDSNVFLMLGNDDVAVNSSVLASKAKGLYKVIHNRRLPLAKGFEIVGYSYVPITPFGIKDWEKYDLSSPPPSLEYAYGQRKLTNYRMSGFRTAASGWVDFRFLPEMESSDSIQKDLEQKLFTASPRKTVYVMHSPPSDTSLDMTIARQHVGSFAEKLFIERLQPYLTLHGHIHETVFVSGGFKQQIGKTLCIAPGNHNDSEWLALIVFDLYSPAKAKRLLI
jgi:Icc-related predicted phosphoesterase